MYDNARSAGWPCERVWLAVCVHSGQVYAEREKASVVSITFLLSNHWEMHVLENCIVRG